MFRIKVPASTSNIGAGFDSFGLALDLCNTFDVELSEEDRLENVEERFNNEDNLFLKAFHKGMDAIGKEGHVHATFHCDIPPSSGLGSSASMIIGGIVAASVLHDDALSDQKIFEIACEMEGHPDNVSPCLFGGFTASLKDDDKYITHRMELSEKWHYTLFIPSFEVSTKNARNLLPDQYSREEYAINHARAVYMAEALRTGSSRLLELGAPDTIHTPYRTPLIENFTTLKEITERRCGGVFLISGSGPSCILISKLPITDHIRKEVASLNNFWTIKEVTVSEGTEIWGNPHEI